ncbi:sensor histidine kinase [Chitinophaga nivalis]|uniref:histidine kinase n=1 Tax=Chitinophaga nivalis TaxID=2991709 RepID=A0ABT3IJY6_9BACT|nr:HAMP domain-containing sensor histidine kinase [Chitinophaga nivalis]MCW3466066.1 HAMP domain-containing histidine kinase [Chitinophaga nivalis]MCW3484243.1 HAMP domain-containing histidine kinase [Chitinophaga nivalis]
MFKELAVRYWGYIVHVGIDPAMSFIEARRIKLLNLLALPCIPFMFFYAILNTCQHRYLLASLNLTTTLVNITVLLMHRYRMYYSARIVMIFFSVVLYTFTGMFFHNGAEYFLLNILILSILVYDNRWIVVGLSLMVIAAFLLILFLPQQWYLAPPVPQVRVWSNVSVSLLFIIVALSFFKYIQSDYQQQIEQQRQELAAMNKDKEKLFSVVAHDIRSPLATLEVLLDMYRKGEYPAQEMSAATEALYQKIVEMGGSLDNVLRWSARNIRGIRWRPESFPLAPLVQEVLSFCQLLIQQKQLVLQVEIPVVIELYADRDQVSVILRNILNNAIKFSYTGESISVRAEQDQEMVQIQVADQGTGMPAEQLAILFSGAPGQANGTYGEWGTGLGMLLCKEFTEQNKGHITAASTVGKGTLFTVTLPVAEEDE